MTGVQTCALPILFQKRCKDTAISDNCKFYAHYFFIYFSIKEVNADVQVEQEEYDEIVQIKAMFLNHDYQ